MKHLLLEIVEATEVAALAASKYVGSGDKLTIDKVATEAMRIRLNQIPMNGKIVIGEGKKDGSFGLYEGEWVGKDHLGHARHCDCVATEEMLANMNDPRWQRYVHEFDIAVDPVDGTTQTAKGGYEAMSVIAVGGFNTLLATEAYYMNKIAVGREVARAFHPSIKEPIEDIVKSIQYILDKRQITVCLLDRPRHNALVEQLRACNCRIKFMQDCDVSGAIAAALPGSGIDLFVGIGGAPEGVISAAALKCLGGYFEGGLVNNKTYEAVDKKVYCQEELAKGDVMFAATGITNGSLLKGVVNKGHGYVTNSILMESSTKSLKRVKSYYGA